jgi:uncharacterized protein DUF6452
MKKLKIIALSILLANSFWGCEKDDICTEGTPTTPSVVIEFYDALNPTNLKSVTNLMVVSPGYAEVPYTSASKIKVPLKTNDIATSFDFIQNGSDEDTANNNTDVLTFNYTKNDVFISRACGFKTVFQLSAGTPLIPDTSNWIQNIVVEQPNIQNENETHIKIYF